MPITILDAIVIVVMLTSAILAMVRGFVREVLSLAAWGAAAAASYYFHKPVVPLVGPYVESSIVAIIIAAAVIFFVALVIASYLTMRISDFIIDSRIGALDRIMGFVFGTLRGGLLLVVAFLFFDWAVQPSPNWVSQSSSKPVLESIGQRVVAALPEDFEAIIEKFIRPGGPSGSNSEPPAEAGADATPNDANYGTGTRQGLDQLIENSGSARQ